MRRQLASYIRKFFGSVYKKLEPVLDCIDEKMEPIFSYFHITIQNFPDTKVLTWAKISLYFMITYAVAWSSYIPLYAFYFQNIPAALAVSFIGFPTALAALFWQRRYNSLKTANLILNYGCALTLVACVAVTGGIYSPIFFWTFSPLIATYLLSGIAHGVGVTSIISVGNSLVALTVNPTHNKALWFFNFDVNSAFYERFYALTVFLATNVASFLAFLFSATIGALVMKLEQKTKIAEEALKSESESRTLAERELSKNKALLNSIDILLAVVHKDLQITNLENETTDDFRAAFGNETDFKAILEKLDLNVCADLLNAVIGESSLTWAVNEDSWPKEATINNQKHDLLFNPIYNDSDEVIAVVFAAKNIQSSIDMQEEVNKATKTAMKLQHVYENKAGFAKFVKKYSKQIDDVISRTEISLLDNHNNIFVALHTMKSEAGSLLIEKLQKTIHTAEDFMKKVREDLRTIKPIDYIDEAEKVKEKLLPILHEIKRDVVEYKKICNNFGINNDNVSIPRWEIKKAIEEGRDLKEFFTEKTCDTVKNVIQSYEEEIDRIGRDLNKPSPRLVISCQTAYIEPDAEDVLRTALIHVIRNAVDHGLETREERVRKNKPEVGEIVFNGSFNGEYFDLKLHDDGQGLNLQKIKAKAMNARLIEANQALSNLDIANLIFLTGLSTTDSVSMVSGRGVGMDAIRQSIESIGGKVEISLKDDTMQPAWELIFKLPKKAFGI